MSKTYPTEDAAQKRVEALKGLGIWPGIIRLPFGRGFRLTHDPADEAVSR